MRDYAFICSANMCRSPMAQAIFQYLVAERRLAVGDVFSAGTLGFEGHPPVDEAQVICMRYDIRLPNIRSQAVTSVAARLASCERVFVMEQSHHDYVREHVPSAPVEMLGRYRKDVSLDVDIQDPMGLDIDAFDRCFNLLMECTKVYLDQSGLDQVGH